MSPRGRSRRGRQLLVLALSSWVAACQPRERAPAPLEAGAKFEIEQRMKQLLLVRVDDWLAASRAMLEAAPLHPGRGWSAAEDADALARMRQAWRASRAAYARIEAAVAPLFPESERATNGRYEQFLSELGPSGDDDAFDERGVIGMHAMERILWADRVPSDALAFERGLPGYRPARFPEGEAEARSFEARLGKRLLSDIELLRSQLAGVELDVAFAFRSLLQLAAIQFDKVERAAMFQEESRYAQVGLDDLRANHQGCLDTYRSFEPWIVSRPGGDVLHRSVLQGFERLAAAYARWPGPALPPLPDRSSPLAPTLPYFETPFGQLLATVRRECDAKVQGSLRAELARVGALLALPALPEPRTR